MRPQSIVLFDRAYLAGIILSIINFAVSWNGQMALMRDNPGVAANPAMADAVPALLIGGVALGTVISLLLWYFTAYKRSNITRWIIVVFFALGLLGLIGLPTAMARFGMVYTVLVVVGILLQVFAVVMLFRPDSQAWFARRDPVDPQTFN